jgi:hypothetical protein
MCPDSGSTLNSYLGNITTGIYGNYWFCVWIIAPANASRVAITFSEFFTEGPAQGTVGDWAYVWECIDSTCTNSKLLGSFAGTAAVIPRSIISTTGVMRVQFFSDASWVGSGFHASYSTPCPPGSFGPGLPQCSSCRTSCPAPKTLIDACGGYGSITDSVCVCPVGEFADGPSSTCLLCGECGPGTALHSRARLVSWRECCRQGKIRLVKFCAGTAVEFHLRRCAYILKRICRVDWMSGDAPLSPAARRPWP